MKISEVFYSLQGEGSRVGQASIFVRLSGCDLACGFCDTEFESGRDVTNEELLDLVNAATRRVTGKNSVIGMWIVWTGGEPCLQLTKEIVDHFRGLGFFQAIETNGNHRPPDGLDLVCCSPKVAEHVLEKNFPNGVDELRYVRHSGQPGVPRPRITAKHHYLSPMFSGNKPDPENIKHCIQLCLENPKWTLSLQTHKLTKIL